MTLRASELASEVAQVRRRARRVPPHPASPPRRASTVVAAPLPPAVRPEHVRSRSTLAPLSHPARPTFPDSADIPPPAPLARSPRRRAQAFLTALDTSLSRTYRDEERRWRSEDREWRAEDMHFRVEERDWWHLEHLWRQENRKWRREDVEQRVLENARWVWLRYAEKNRRDVEEKSEQLKSISNLSALIAGFAVVAFVELQFSDPAENPTHVHELLIVAYALTTALVVALMLNSMVLCSFMLCSILRNGKTYVSEEEEAEYLYRCRQFALEFKPGDVPPAPKRSFERHWETRCEDDWKHAFRMFTGGVPVFLANVACISWLKFHYSPPAAGAVTAVAVLAALGWAHTQNNWGWHVARGARKQREGSHAFGGAGGPPRSGAGLPFDWHARPSAARGGSEHPRRDEEPTEEPTTTPGRIHARRDDAEDRAGSAMADDTTSRSSSASEGSGDGSVGVGAADVRARVDDLAERGGAGVFLDVNPSDDGDGGVAGEGGPRLRVATKPSRRSGEGGAGRRVASWADLGDAARTSEERAFVCRTSPRARDIAAARAAAAARTPTTPASTPASTPAVEDPFEGAAAALGDAAAGARGEDRGA